jgi:hypothetical protein
MLELLKKYVYKPNDEENNFNLALHYDSLGQTASAVSFYIRTAERTQDDLLKYECLIKAALCFERQGTRKFSVKGLLQQAVAVQPKRPEGYYILSRFHEHNTANEGRWLDSYTIASIGLSVADFDNLKPLRTPIDYPGRYGLIFQKAVVGWHCGLCEESKNLFIDLYDNYKMSDIFYNAVVNNLKNLNVFNSKDHSAYSKNKFEKIKLKFEGLESIDKNYSEAYQDMFVLTSHNGKKNGSYVEIGYADPIDKNNTYLLETNFNWSGISLDTKEESIKEYNIKRKNKCVLKDPTVVDYNKFLNGLMFGDTIDYLQINMDDIETSYNVLLSMPFDTKKFGVITFKHNNANNAIRESACSFLKSYGYELVVNNVSINDHMPYEDWFVHPDIISEDTIAQLKSINDKTKKAEKYMFGDRE